MEYEHLTSELCTVHRALRFVDPDFRENKYPNGLLVNKPELREAIIRFWRQNDVFEMFFARIAEAQRRLHEAEKMRVVFIDILPGKKALLDKNRVGGIRVSVFKGIVEATENDIFRAGILIEHLKTSIDDHYEDVKIIQATIPRFIPQLIQDIIDLAK